MACASVGLAPASRLTRRLLAGKGGHADRFLAEVLLHPNGYADALSDHRDRRSGNSPHSHSCHKGSLRHSQGTRHRRSS